MGAEPKSFKRLAEREGCSIFRQMAAFRAGMPGNGLDPAHRSVCMIDTKAQQIFQVAGP
jgi:hypothetical protein